MAQNRKLLNKSTLHISLLAGIWAFIAVYQAVGTFFFTDEYYSFREFECAKIGRTTGPFRPHFVRKGLTSGDLSHMAGVPQLKKYHYQEFSTDEYGFRNPVGTADKPCDVVIVGDSFCVGLQASDNETLSGFIRHETGLNVYNYCGATIPEFFGDERFHQNPPRLVIFLCVERDLSPGSDFFIGSIRPHSPQKYLPSQVYKSEMPITVLTFQDFIQKLSDDRMLKHHAEGIYKGFLYLVGIYRFPPSIFYYDRKMEMFYFNMSGKNHLDPQLNLHYAKAVLILMRKYRNDLKSRGISFLVLVVPDKETVYHRYIPQLKNKNVFMVLDFFHDGLKKYGIDHVRINDVFTQYDKMNPDSLLYYPDDTHMNETATRIIFNAIKDRLPLKK